MLEVEPQKDRIATTTEALPQEECREHMNVMVLHTPKCRNNAPVRNKKWEGEKSAQRISKEIAETKDASHVPQGIPEVDTTRKSLAYKKVPC
eukprot:5551881-Heterocapsa_arctica.AAC.1